MNEMVRHTNKRVGRKRLVDRERYDNGRTAAEKEGMSPGMIRQMIQTAHDKARDPLLRTELGRWMLEKLITADECSAGTKLAEIVADYDHKKGIPPRFAKSPDYMGGYGKSLREEPDPRSIAKAEERYLSALRAMGHCKDAVINLVVYDMAPVGFDSKLKARTGLGELAWHFGLTTAKK